MALLRHFIVGCYVSSSTLSAACSSPPAAVHAPAPRRLPPPEKPAELGDRDWETVRSLRHSLELPLPARTGWTLDDKTDPWFVARHPPTSSELRARTWTAPRLVQPAECEAQARLWRPDLPPSQGDASIVRRALSAPDGYRGQLVAGVMTEGGGLEGYVLAVGSTIGRCYAAVFITRATGSGADEAIGRRLALIVGGVLGRVHVRSVDERALENSR